MMNSTKLAMAICAIVAAAPCFGTQEDEAAIREIVKASSAGKPNPHIAVDLDWENAFGARYNDLKKRDAYYSSVAAPLEKDDTNTTLEVKVKFVDPSVAVADEYWHIVGQIDQRTNKPGADRWGRTTYLFKKQDGVWTEVLERVADLRAPYYKHYDKLPQGVPVSPQILASYSGAYESARGKRLADVSVAGDHLEVTTRNGKFVAIPTSNTEFLDFDPNDLADYQRITFAVQDDGSVLFVLLDESGEKILDARKGQ
jgi:hypothetical protein